MIERLGVLVSPKLPCSGRRWIYGRRPYSYDFRTEGREGGWPKRDDSTVRMRDWDSDKREGGPKPPKICGCHLSMALATMTFPVLAVKLEREVA